MGSIAILQCIADHDARLQSHYTVVLYHVSARFCCSEYLCEIVIDVSNDGLSSERRSSFEGEADGIAAAVTLYLRGLLAL